MKPIIVLLGPTATGKSSLAIDLAQVFQAEIISADSRQIYTEFTIGSGKVLPSEIKSIPHHMINIKHIWEQFNVSQFQTMTQEIIENLHARETLPFLVGGTGLYIDAVIKDYQIPPQAPNKELREQLSHYSLAELHSILQNQYPDRVFNKSDWNNPIRLIRAIEILSSPSSSTRQLPSSPYTPLYIGLSSSLDTIKERIIKRVDTRLSLGAIDEIVAIHDVLKDHVTPSEEKSILQSLGLGTIAICQFLDQTISYDMMRERYIQSEYQYARRQLTWFRKNTDIHWFKAEDNELIKNTSLLIKNFLK